MCVRDRAKVTQRDRERKRERKRESEMRTHKLMSKVKDTEKERGKEWKVICGETHARTQTLRDREIKRFIDGNG